MTQFRDECAKKLEKIRRARAKRDQHVGRAAAAAAGDAGEATRRARLSFGSSRTRSSLSSMSSVTRRNGGANVTKDWVKKFRRASHTRPYLKCFTARKRSLLFNLGVLTFPEATCRVAELSQNLSWSRVLNVVPCLTPSGEKYLTKFCRPLLGVEALRLQGMWWRPNAPYCRSFPDKLLRDIAGNAFEASCFAASFFASFLLRARLLRMRHGQRAGTELSPRARFSRTLASASGSQIFSVSDSDEQDT